MNMFLTQYAFGTMIGLSGSEMNIQFGFGPTELGMVMTCVGLFQIVANAVLSPKIIRCLGLKNTLMLGTTCIGVGILYPLVDSSFVLQLLLWLPLVASFPLQQPSTGGIVGAATHPLRRGAAMGLVVGSMSLGRALAPFTSGLLMTEAKFLLTSDYAETQAEIWLSQRAPRDASCTEELAATSGCTPPDYEILFPTVFSIAPHILGAILTVVGLLVVLVVIPADPSQKSQAAAPAGENGREGKDPEADVGGVSSGP